MLCVTQPLFRSFSLRWRRAVPLCTEMRELRIGNSQFARFEDIYPLYTHTKGQELVVLLPTHTRVCEALLGGLGSAQVPHQ